MSSPDVCFRISRRFQRHHVTLTSAESDALVQYFYLLTKWNTKINLTSLPLDPAGDEAIDRLLVEPVIAARYLLKEDQFAIDLGSGGGSPAIPMKIAAPWLKLLMVEAKARKSAFLREVARQLRLAAIEVANTRFEELLTRADLHESTDVVTVRAVRADQKLWSTAQAFLRPGGRIFWFTAEASRVHLLPPLSLETERSLVPGTSARLVILRKHG